MPSAAGGAGVPFGAIVAAKSHERVVRNTECTKFFSQPTHLFVQRGDAAVIMLRKLAVFRVEFGVFRPGHHGEMRCVEPHDGKERLLLFDRRANEGNGTVHDHARIIAAQILRHARALFVPVRGSVRPVVLGGIPPRFALTGFRAQHRIPRGHFGFRGKTHVKSIDLWWREILYPTRTTTVGFRFGFCERAEMPFAEMTSGVAMLFK